MSTITSIIVKVSFEDDNTDELASAVCVIDARNLNKVKSSDIVDACQRAVAHCVEELEKELDKP